MAAVSSFREFYTFIQHLYGQFPESMLQLGLLLRGGMPLAEVFYNLSQSAVHQRLRAVSALAARRLSSGEGCGTVFSGKGMDVFPPAIRYILAAPLSDVTKGRLIADWKFRSKGEFRIGTALYYPVQSMAVGILTSISLYLFVFPQMREIFLSANIKTTPFAAWLLEMCGSGSLNMEVLVIGAFAVLLSFVVLLTRMLTRFPQKIDEMNLLRMLAVLPPEERVKAFDVMAVRHNFPALHGKFRRLARALDSGSDTTTACRDAGLDDMLTWFLALGLVVDSSEPRLLTHAADYLNVTVESSFAKTISLLELSSVLFQAVVFGSLAYALVQMMISMSQSIAL